jgi:hypothetical protein
MELDPTALSRPSLTTPRSAAVAGILFSVLLSTSLVLLAMTVPAQPEDVGSWLGEGVGTVTLALNLIPFAGIAFLWFLGVVRDRLGAFEDRFFATVLLGSGLIFLAMLFATAAVGLSTLGLYGSDPASFMGTSLYGFGRLLSYHLMHTFTMRMASVFMLSTCTIAIRTGFLPKWLSMLGYGMALILMIGAGLGTWSSLAFPIWIMVLSAYILVSNLRTNAA